MVYQQKKYSGYKEFAIWSLYPEHKLFFVMMASFEHLLVELIDGFIDAETQFRMET